MGWERAKHNSIFAIHSAVEIISEDKHSSFIHLPVVIVKIKK